MWPYTGRTRSFDSAELPINVVVRGEASTLRQLLTTDGDGRWNETERARAARRSKVGSEVGTEIEWSPGHGANRYTYVWTGDGGRWLAQTDQLRDGSYFGTQYHLRVYDLETGDDPGPSSRPTTSTGTGSGCGTPSTASRVPSTAWRETS